MIKVENFCLNLGNFKLKNINFSVEDGQYCILLGPSGAGKTLLMECIVGLRKPDRGRIFLNGREVTDIPPEERNIGYLPQDYALFPFMNVYRNISFGLRLRKFTADEIKTDVEDVADSLNIKHLLYRLPSTLSGGEKQRVALARAFIINPYFLLLDEPYCSLDANLKRNLWLQMLRFHRRTNKTTVHITHDLEEAFTLGEKVIVLINGYVEQSGSREDVFYHCNSFEVASFLGISNILYGRIISTNRKEDNIKIRWRGYTITSHFKEGFSEGSKIRFCIRPQEIKIIREGRPIKEELRDNLFRGRIVDSISHGATYTLYFRIFNSLPIYGSEHDFEIIVPAYTYLKLNLQRGKEIMVGLRKKAIQVFKEI